MSFIKILLLATLIFCAACKRNIEKSDYIEAEKEGRNLIYNVDNVKIYYNAEVKSVFYSGPIKNMAVQFVQGFGKDVDSLHITSTGGDISAAMSLSDWLENNEAMVVLSEYCLSACAHFIAVPAKRVTVRRGTVVGFHHSSATILSRAARPLMLESQAFEHYSRIHTDAQVEFYKQRGIDPRWLIEPDLRTIPVCTYLGIVTSGSHPIVRYENEFELFVPSNSLLEQINPNRIYFITESELDDGKLIDFSNRFDWLEFESILFSDIGKFTATPDQMNSLNSLPLCE